MTRSHQPELFPVPPQPRRSRPEPDRVWRAALYLRSAGATVYRAGRQEHMVNGNRITTRQLLALAGEA